MVDFALQTILCRNVFEFYRKVLNFVVVGNYVVLFAFQAFI